MINPLTIAKNTKANSSVAPGIFLMSVIILFFSACVNQEVCEDVAVVPVRIGFYRVDTTVTTPVRYPVNNLTISGIGSDSIFYSNQDNVGQVELPLNSAQDMTIFVFQWQPEGMEETIRDTVQLVYIRKPNLISMECGFTTFYELTEARHQGALIDLLTIENSNIRTTLDEHIKIYPVIPAAGR
jgi:hypothetical protein